VPDTLSPSPPSRRLHPLAVSTLSPSPPSRRLHPLAVSTLSRTAALSGCLARRRRPPWPLAPGCLARRQGLAARVQPSTRRGQGLEEQDRPATRASSTRARGPPAHHARPPPTTRVLRLPRAVLLVADRPAAALVLGTHPRASPASPASCPSPVSRTRRRATPSPRRLVGRRRLSTPSRRRLSTPSRRRLSTHPRWGHQPILPHPQAHPGPSPVPRVTPRACTPTPRQSRRGDASTAACLYHSIL
jgi:hypothetical protein